MTRPTTRRATRSVVLLVLAAVALVATASPASAHVGAEATTDGSGATRIELSFSHGCEAEPTTTLRAQVPEGATDVAAEDVAGWESAVEPGQVTWRGGSVPDGQSATFAFTARLAQPDGAEVPVPTIQECPTLTNEWIEPPTDDHSEASSPAPVIVVPAGAGEQAAVAESAPVDAPVEDEAEDEAVTGAAPDLDESQALPEESGDPTAEEQAQASSDDESAAAGGTAGTIVFLVVMAVIIGGGVLLYLRNRRPSSPS